MNTHFAETDFDARRAAGSSSRITPLARLLHLLTAFAHGLRQPLARFRRRRESIRALSRLNDRQLRDIGIERDRIADVVDGLARR